VRAVQLYSDMLTTQLRFFRTIFYCTRYCIFGLLIAVEAMRRIPTNPTSLLAREIYLLTLIASIVSIHSLTFESLTALTSNLPIIKQFSSNR